MKSFMCFVVLAAGVSSAGASDAIATAEVRSDIDLIFELGAGGRYQPKYEGADDYEVIALPIIGFSYINIPGLIEFGSLSPQDYGFSFGPSFNYTSERDIGDEDPDLAGLDKVDGTFELGARASYAWNFAEVWGEARYAFGGAEGLVGEFGANAVIRPTEQLEFKAGPFATLASSEYMNDYFGVSAQEAANTGFTVNEFEADGGFKSIGVKASARYEFRPDWFLSGEASYSKLTGDVSDSPIVVSGNDDQFTVGLGLSKRFSLDLF